ncbi:MULTISPECIES: 1-deoxy-D-xylulose-5-phosphate synthase [Streptomyces]|uniref:1-deoxy-D-xylulose-5-phosphate synthase n=1 Tax=Streptomyces albus (strain ATCC 21838 / DSM 41398 / FERM P-419 / JCM 4703 / NBRC 107858) TaxID=1081613 RepID=A0A0B5EQ83_STRA4|nr:1-deoxy-D-xylulose-5-phosphate synthase [Streptomyces sp. SCSIO ZS0520]AJE81460.1 1-deoxy-D-xylulose-5-phosphate synthase [Streptomyces albus]AOU75775.1 1-deoxy-D-xylulose-5-phosphate synthase [Streptomyces albus]AYN31579.1 1-deoxy-D-xylulose-5-phosphate synthase [Streptomyces albus]UFZ14074.1 1-deoxy-D-xylulose-5-phosphate synthase [Streptomyces sp.]
MALLEEITQPGDLRELSHPQLAELAAEIREVMIDTVTRVGGHLGPNLGVVELTIALHRVFDSPKDTLLWDIGHQTYVQKLLTGRRAAFDGLRLRGGISGYASRAESPHDVIENSHASTALSYADGLARARELTGESDRAVVAVIGDGALTGGLAWEALNNLGGAPQRPVIVVLNDNERSYAPTVGGLAAHLTRLRAAGAGHHPADGNVFEEFGFGYLGPVDGHDTAALEEALTRATALGGPVLVHVVTEKGRGWRPAETNDLDRCHVVRAAPKAVAPGAAAKAPAAPSWTSVFSEEMVRIGAEREDVVALTAAMPEPVGLLDFLREFPERAIDVGIAEQHAAAAAAGLALGGLHPVLAVYATFGNRLIDQMITDIALHSAPVTLVMDRAGITGDDGASHNGMWDLTLFQAVPNTRIAAPRDGTRLRELLREAVAWEEGPTVLRFPKGSSGEDIPALDSTEGFDVLHNAPGRDVLIVSVGPMARLALDVAERLAESGIGATVVDPRWVAPVNPTLVEAAAYFDRVVTLEDSGRTGGVGSAFAQALGDAGIDTPVRTFGIPRAFLDHGSRAQVLEDCGLTPGAVTAQIHDWRQRRSPVTASGAPERTSL